MQVTPSKDLVSGLLGADLRDSSPGRQEGNEIRFVEQVNTGERPPYL